MDTRSASVPGALGRPPLFLHGGRIPIWSSPLVLLQRHGMCSPVKHWDHIWRCGHVPLCREMGFNMFRADLFFTASSLSGAVVARIASPKWFSELTCCMAGEPVVGHPGVCNHEVPLVLGCSRYAPACSSAASSCGFAVYSAGAPVVVFTVVGNRNSHW